MDHHYIPQFYLRPWLGADHKLQEFRRGYGNKVQSRRYGTKPTGYVEDLYALPGVSEDTRHNIETLFMAPVDTSATRARDLLLQGIIPTDELRPIWARFLLSLLLRSPEQIAAFKKNVADGWNKPDAAMLARYEKERKPHWPKTFDEVMRSVDPALAERTAVLMATRMMQRETVIQLFMSAMWWVLDVSEFADLTFMTSDHPVIMTDGLGRDDGHFAIPIGPKHLFIGCMNQNIRASIQSLPPREIVRIVNERVIGQGRKCVYAVDNANLDLVREKMGTMDYMAFLPEEY